MAINCDSTVVSTANFLLQCARRQPQLLREEALQMSLGMRESLKPSIAREVLTHCAQRFAAHEYDHHLMVEDIPKISDPMHHAKP